MPLQPSSTCSWLKPDPSINELSKGMPLYHQLLVQTGQNTSPRSYKVRRLFSHLFNAQEERNGPPSANQGLSKVEPRLGHALQVHQPTSPRLAKEYCQKWHLMHSTDSYIRESVKRYLWFLKWRKCVSMATQPVTEVALSHPLFLIPRSAHFNIRQCYKSLFYTEPFAALLRMLLHHHKTTCHTRFGSL